MTIHFDFAKYSCQLARFVDYEGAALNAPVRPSIHAFLLVDPIGFRDDQALVAQQRKG